MYCIYTPHQYKTKHKGKKRPIPIEKESQAILVPYLIEKEDCPEDYLFKPGDAVRLIAIEKRIKRKSNVQPSQTHRKKGRKHPFRECYTKDAYGTAIQRAAERAGVPKWSPNQLRHTRATQVNDALGIEATQLLLGHSSTETTQIYLDPEVELKKQTEDLKKMARKMPGLE